MYLLWNCQLTLVMISKYCFRYCFYAVRQQAITWANVDPDLMSYDITRSHWLNYIYSCHIVMHQCINQTSNCCLRVIELHKHLNWQKCKYLSIITLRSLSKDDNQRDRQHGCEIAHMPQRLATRTCVKLLTWLTSNSKQMSHSVTCIATYPAWFQPITLQQCDWLKSGWIS